MGGPTPCAVWPNQASGSPVLPWIFTCQPSMAGSLTDDEDACLSWWKSRALLLWETCPVHFAQLSMPVWKYNTQMNRNKNILNLEKLSNTIGKTSELKVNPRNVKKENPRNVSSSAVYWTPNETYALHPLCLMWISCPDQYHKAWHSSSFETLSSKHFSKSIRKYFTVNLASLDSRVG